MGPTQNVTFLLTRMRADGHFLGHSRLCQIDFNNNFYMAYMNFGGGCDDTVFNSFAKLFPELKDTVDPCRLVFIDDETGEKICLENLDTLDKDLSCILNKKYKFNEEKFCAELNEGKHIRLGIVKLSDERKDVESNMLNVAGSRNTSQKN